MAVCPDCSGSGAFSYPCKKCDGTGVFLSPKTGKQVGKCRLCGGSGRFFPQFKEDKERPLKSLPTVVGSVVGLGKFETGWKDIRGEKQDDTRELSSRRTQDRFCRLG